MVECEKLWMEFWDVPPESEERWLDYYENVVIAALQNVQAYGGSMIFRKGVDGRGPDDVDRVIRPHWGVRTLGVRTNASINLGALLQHEYTFMVMLFMKRDVNLLPEFFDGVKQIDADWRDRYPEWQDDPGAAWLPHPWLDDYFRTGETVEQDTRRVVDLMSRDFFSLANNHWDMGFDHVYSRFPDAQVRTDGDE